MKTQVATIPPIWQEKKYKECQRKVKILMLTSTYLSPTDLLSISLMTVSDILNRYIWDHLVLATITYGKLFMKSVFYPKLFATSSSFHTAVQVDPGSKKRSTPNSAAIKSFFISHFRKRWEINLTAGEFWENIIFAILKKRIFKRLVKINFFRK